MRKDIVKAILCDGKSNEQILSEFSASAENLSIVIGTRVAPDHYDLLSSRFSDITYKESGRVIIRVLHKLRRSGQRVAVLTGGLADTPVAEEAAAILDALGIDVLRVPDVGVSALDRLLTSIEEIREADAVIVVAGMEAALLSVVGGLVSSPVIGVPTSVGYGTHLSGFTAALCMLNSCAAGCTVVNVDNGFGAAMAVARLCMTKVELA